MANRDKEIVAGSEFPMLMQEQLRRIDETGLVRDGNFDDAQFIHIAEELARFVRAFKKNSTTLLRSASGVFRHDIKELDRSRPAFVDVSISGDEAKGKEQGAVARELAALLRSCSNDIHVLSDCMQWLSPAVAAQIKSNMQLSVEQIIRDIPESTEFDSEPMLNFSQVIDETIREFCSRSGQILNDEVEREKFLEKLLAIVSPNRMPILDRDKGTTLAEAKSNFNDSLLTAKDCLNYMINCIEVTK